ncbi:HAD family hydrolase [Chlorogloeopsis sp. ULAP02]|uniref:HAD family hydrolase n=1 Tax=Chlorogloeopsis sp. ULAP02 TaxID=3107926 RepID=UPI0031366E4E
MNQPFLKKRLPSNKLFPIIRVATIAALFVVAIALSVPLVHGQSTPTDPLPSWNDGAVKKSIIEFVSRVTKEGSSDFVPVTDRIATFDNDGTLWPEKPLIQGMFVLEKLKRMAAADPSFKKKQPFKAVLEGNVAYFSQVGEEAVIELFGATHSNITQEQFEAETQAFFKKGIHPRFKVPYTQLAYQPMVELMQYLRANGFQTWICSGGGIDFIRTISQQMYAIPPQQVIGSSLKKEFIEKDGKRTLWRKPELDLYNDKAGKPVGIDLHIGKHPVFAGGNVRSGGDIAMLTYSQGLKTPSFQLLINHDDAKREFAYQEKDNASLKAAKANSWAIASIKQDWKTVFRLSDNSANTMKGKLYGR